ncbi:MAG: bifunctional phosphopantothenoylcysteine decarboxylase/phosphopantothenate--cysteine ligase CoaBC [Bdellovibrio bacteriovorus]
MSAAPPPRVLLAVGGGIAAYKAAELVRRLRERGAEVRVVMTRAAVSFVSPLTFQALSGHPARLELLVDPGAEAGMDHIELARWAERLVVAPATADLIARLAAGLADDLPTTLALATQASLYVVPAMNQAMWRHPATQDNIAKLAGRGVQILGPAEGSQACGDLGPGRMWEPEAIAEVVVRPLAVAGEGPLEGVRALVTAGPTREPLDPVRYLSNRSSGRMGYALAGALAELGAKVVLVSGPTGLPEPACDERVLVETALQMHAAVMERIDACDLFVATAAVADYRPAEAEPRKIKKTEAGLRLHLARNPDILAEVAARSPPPFTVGFAAETERVEDYARGKLVSKGLNLIAANRVGAAVGGFERDENALVVLWRDGRRELPLMPKVQLARELALLIAERYAASS